MALSSRWKKRPNGSTWGDFGPDDQLGRLNLLTTEKVRQGTFSDSDPQWRKFIGIKAEEYRA